jgi:hypothetical protein
MLKLAIAILFLIPNVALGATIYIDGQLAVNCSSNNYSISNRTCTGKDGNAYNNIQSALTASAANDTIYFRSGSITSNITGTDGISTKNGQTWAQYPGDTPRSTTITGDATNQRVFTVSGDSGVNDVVIRDLVIVGGFRFGIFVTNSSRTKIINNEIRGFNNTADSGNGGVAYWAAGASPNALDGEITDNYIHSPVLTATDHTGVTLASIGAYVSNILVARNRIVGTRFGVWLDVQACQPARGATPCTIEGNYIKNTGEHCLHAEIGSTATWRRNICDSPGRIGMLLRPGATDQNTQTKIYNNTFYNPGRSGSFGEGIWIQNDQATANVTNLEVKNNIIYRSGGADHYALQVGTLTIGQTTNRYQNNLFYMVSSTNGICWGSPASSTGPGCSPGTVYDDTTSGIAAWQVAAPSGVGSGNIVGDPLFANPAGEDFRLCTGVGIPVASCTGKSPAIDAGANVGLSFQGLAPDIGAIESGATGQAELVPTVPTAPTLLRWTSP